MLKKASHKCYFACVIDGPIHRFPNIKNERFSKWKSVLNVEVQEKGDTYNNTRLCYRHFEACYRLPSHKLTQNAVPTLNIDPLELKEEPVAIDSEPNMDTNVISVQPTLSQLTTCSTQSPNTAVSLPQTSQHEPSICRLLGRKRPYRPKHNCCKKLAQQKAMVAELTQKLKILRKKVQKKQTQMKIAKRLSMKKSFLKTLEKLPASVKTFTTLQLKCNKKPKGRRFMMEEKQMALTIYKKSPKAYRILKRMFVLPSKRTMQKLLS